LSLRPMSGVRARAMLQWDLCGGVVNNQITKCLLQSLPVTLFKSVNTWQSY